MCDFAFFFFLFFFFPPTLCVFFLLTQGNPRRDKAIGFQTLFTPNPSFFLHDNYPGFCALKVLVDLESRKLTISCLEFDYVLKILLPCTESNTEVVKSWKFCLLQDVRRNMFQSWEQTRIHFYWGHEASILVKLSFLGKHWVN